MRRFTWGLLALLALMPALWALDNEKKDSTKSAADEFKALSAEYEKAMTEYSAALAAAKTVEQRRELLAKRPDQRKFAIRVADLAEKHEKEPFAVEALVWLVQFAPTTPEGKQAVDTIQEKHTASDKIGPVCVASAIATSPTAEKTLRSILEKNKHPNVQAHAMAGLGKLLKTQAGARGKTAEEVVRLNGEAEKVMDEAIAKFPDAKIGKDSLATFLGNDLFELKNLAVGKQAPEIEAEDTDGNKFKLSDYRGKVVMLDFWGHW
jgi:hypothetical protein